MNSSVSDGAAILLAAGNSSRYGSDKRLALIGGIPMLHVTLSKYVEIFHRTIVVLKPGEEHLLASASGNHEIVIADRANEGMSQSINAAVEYVRDVAWVVIGLADMPNVQAPTLKKLRNELEANHEAILRLRHNDTFGNPVGIPKLYFNKLRKLSGDIGARAIFNQPDVKSVALDVEDAGILYDVDEPKSLMQLSSAS